jgi:hypothetical protein
MTVRRKVIALWRRPSFRLPNVHALLPVRHDRRQRRGDQVLRSGGLRPELRCDIAAIVPTRTINMYAFNILSRPYWTTGVHSAHVPCNKHPVVDER